MARNRTEPAGSTGADLNDDTFNRSDDETSEAAPSTSTDDGEGAVYVQDNNPSVDFLDEGTTGEPDEKVRCNCGAVEWDSQDAGLNPVAADLDGTRHTVDECRSLEDIMAERRGEST